jgi:hypothetical protein
MNKTKHQTKAVKVREKQRLLQEEQRVLGKKIISDEKTIPLKVAHKRQKSNNAVADSTLVFLALYIQNQE